MIWSCNAITRWVGLVNINMFVREARQLIQLPTTWYCIYRAYFSGDLNFTNFTNLATIHEN